MCSGSKLSSAANSGFFAWAFQVLISVSHFLLDFSSLSVLVPLTMWLETEGLKWLGPQTPEHQASFSITCYPFISCFSQRQILPFYSSAIWQPPYIPLHHHGDKARGSRGMAVALVDRPTSRRPWQKLRVWCSQECRLAVNYWAIPRSPGSSFSLCTPLNSSHLDYFTVKDMQLFKELW